MRKSSRSATGLVTADLMDEVQESDLIQSPEFKVLDALREQIAILDAGGTIVFANLAWRRCGLENGHLGATMWRGQNYLRVCDQATGDFSDEARDVAEGIRKVIAGKASEFVYEYPCHSESHQRWFKMVVTPNDVGGTRGALIMHVDVTNATLRDQIAKRTQQSEERLQYCVDAAELGYWSIDIATHEATRSLRHDQCYGFTESQPDWKLEDALARIHPEDLPEVELRFVPVMSGQGEYDGEFRVIWPDGSIHWIWAKGKCYFDETGAPACVAGVVGDVTERKRVKSALETSQVLFSGAFAHAPVGVALVSPNGKYLRVNRSLCEFTGYTESELLELSFQEITHPEDLPASLELFRKLLAGEIPVLEDSERFVHASGKIVNGFMRASVVRDANGVPMYQIVQILDVTEVEQGRQALLVANERLNEAQRLANMGDWDFEITTETLTWSPQMYRIFGRNPSSGPPASMQEWGTLFTPEGNKALLATLNRAVETGEQQEYELVGIRPGGELFNTRSQAMPRRDASGNVVAIYGTVQDVTAIKQKDAMLSASTHEVFEIRRALDEHAIVAIADINGRFLAVNDKFCAITQHSREELIGKDAGILNSGYHSNEFMRDLWTTIKGGHAWQGEIRNRAKDGSFYWVTTTIVPFSHDQGEPTQFMVISADIAETKRAEEAFRESEELFERAFQLSPDAIWIARQSDHKIIRANAAACALLSTTEDQVIGRMATAFIAWVDPRQRETFQYVLDQNGECLNFEAQIRRYDQVLIDCNVSSRSITFQEDPCVLNVLRDVTERKKIEVAAARLAAIVTFSGDAIIGKDLNGIITSWNAGAENIFGYSADEIVGQPLLRLIPDDLLEEADSILTRIRGGQAIPTFDTVRVRKDGSRIDVAVTTSPIRDVTGRVIGSSKVARDITERKMVEAQIQQLNEDLELRVAERTAQLKSANEELEAFSYSVSHDLRSPLRSMDGYSHMLLEDYGAYLPEDGKRALLRIRSGSRKLGLLIDDLLSFARLGRATLMQDVVDMNELVADTLLVLQEAQRGRSIDLQIGDLPAGAGDATMLAQVWENLISNALKYTGKRETALIEIGSKQEGEETVYFVRDNGTGFDMLYVGQLFHVFQRLHCSEEFEGTGVGLAIVHRIIERHGGRTWAEAAEGVGATFYFTLGTPANVTAS